MKVRMSTFSLALAAAAFVLSQGSVAVAATKHKTHHAKVHHAGAHHSRVYVRRRTPVLGDPGPPQGYVQGIGPIWYGDGVNGPPNGGAYTTYATNDPSIGWFPGLWDAQRRGGCVIDDGYGRWSGCDDR
jgi:hypothetical protein